MKIDNAIRYDLTSNHISNMAQELSHATGLNIMFQIYGDVYCLIGDIEIESKKKKDIYLVLNSMLVMHYIDTGVFKLT